MSQENNPEVAEWFERSSISRLMPHRVHGETAEHLLGELVRRPGDPSRNTATSLTRREGGPDDRAPGEGEWHGARHRIEEVDNRGDPAYEWH
jgi:hypothetical protein